MSAKLLVYAPDCGNRRKNDSFESGLEKIQKGNQAVETGGKIKNPGRKFKTKFTMSGLD